MEHHEGTFPGAGGLGLYYQRWRPNGAASRASLAIVHGFGEHSGRYMNVVNHLVSRGYTVYGFDHRGHGRSPGQRGYIRRWAEFREDVDRYLRMVREQEPDRPVFLLGHSMGGLVALEYVLRHPEGLAGVIASSPLLAPPGINPFLLRLSRITSCAWPRFSMDARFDPNVLSRDPAVVEAAIEDALCHRRGTARLGTEMAAAISWTIAHAEEVRLPILIFHGTADRLTDPQARRLFFERITFPDKTLCEYEGSYHETLNDVDHQRVLADLEGWLERRL